MNDDNLDENKNENILESHLDNLTGTVLEPIRYTEINDDFNLATSVNKPSILYENFEENNKNIQINNINEDNNNNPNQKQPKKYPSKLYMNQTNNNNTKKNKYRFKIIFIGESSVGKTSIINRFLKNFFVENYECTISTELKTKILELDKNNQAELEIWDTAGEERFSKITKQFYKDSYGAFIIYDITNRESFKRIENWIKDINESASKDIIIGIVGNKNDIKKNRQIEYEEGENYSNNHNALFLKLVLKMEIILMLLFNKWLIKYLKKYNKVLLMIL